MAGHFLNLTIPVTAILLGFGTFLISDSMSNVAPSQVTEIMAGALLLALGLMLLAHEARLVYRWVHAAKADDSRDS